MAAPIAFEVGLGKFQVIIGDPRVGEDLMLIKDHDITTSGLTIPSP